MSPLPHPPNAERDPESAEVLRAWIVDGGLEIAIHPSHWAHQPEPWERLLADAVEHRADDIAMNSEQHCSGTPVLIGFPGQIPKIGVASMESITWLALPD